VFLWLGGKDRIPQENVTTPDTTQVLACLCGLGGQKSTEPTHTLLSATDVTAISDPVVDTNTKRKPVNCLRQKQLCKIPQHNQSYTPKSNGFSYRHRWSSPLTAIAASCRELGLAV
jgi:hypothetical protein